MKAFGAVCGIALSLLLLVSCETAAVEDSRHSDPEGTHEVIDNEGNDKLVKILLDSDPRLHDSMSVQIAPEEQVYTVHFVEPMDKQSVEKALRQQGVQNGTAESEDDITWEGIPFQFHWRSDTELEVSLPAAPLSKLETPHQYVLSLHGARTESGVALGDSPQLKVEIVPLKQIWEMSADGTKIR